MSGTYQPEPVGPHDPMHDTRRGALFGAIGRQVAAIGVSGSIALFFLIMMPVARQPDRTQSFAAALQSFTTALPRQRQSEDAPTPALAEFYSLLVSGNAAQAAERRQPETESDQVFQQFLQWRQKANPGAAAQ